MSTSTRLSDEEIKRASSTDAVEYLQSKGWTLKQTGKDSYPVSPEHHDSLMIRDNVFHWWSKELGGDTIDLAKSLFGYSFPEAVRDILGAGVSIVAPSEYHDKDRLNYRQSLGVTMPQRERDAEKGERCVFGYLCKRRGLSGELVAKMVRDGRLYQDVRGNCVFIIKGTRPGNREVEGAEIIGTGDERFKRVLIESKWDAFTIKIGDWSKDCIPMYVYFESAIDLLSFYQIKNLEDRKNPILLVSLHGVNKDPIESKIKASVSFCAEAHHYIATDNDEAGDRVADEVIAWWQTDPMKKGEDLSKYTVQRLRPDEGFKDWNDILTGTPIES